MSGVVKARLIDDLSTSGGVFDIHAGGDREVRSSDVQMLVQACEELRAAHPGTGWRIQVKGPFDLWFDLTDKHCRLLSRELRAKRKA